MHIQREYQYSKTKVPIKQLEGLLLFGDLSDALLTIAILELGIHFLDYT